MKKIDPTIAGVREARHRISEQCDHDPRRVVEYYMELQKKYQGRLLVSEREAQTSVLAYQPQQADMTRTAR